ncbi:hypothetical protein CYV26_04725 [Carnobacterium maltaromaticum]|uniref:T7SS effector LXG polymorphic toxin n=1 Tax=Carnobacterium maltaromaticum TaxID=2751 RepID=UPI000C78A1CE|nr:ribonuclease domain-containing protein [Carnobacterium maltaromaticum]PLS38035.1 hypothetical protein CYV33_02190 [Carnobacterium maltaromaticum]PLS38412.1 hypothetical protein CYV31_04715 [Carnobacterium maltaromaticum]PLS38789.1 hypothetical protein CYV30_02185 [Carnobacterium maltaromaticum]PLS45059.1 hypothetical protein CYV28_02185 [Carnobacterium maltaromaticum]PLS47916.1 hypothetical protein CYV27_00230 [Carnobacterium maltaromaticum]
MSINMYVGEVRQQVQSINSNCQSTVATMEQIQQALSVIIIEPGLKGATYESMKNYFNTVYMPVTKGFILVCERMIEANQQFLNRYLDQVDVNSLQESVLEERIRQYNRLSEMLDSIVDPIGFNARMIDGLQDMRQETVRKLDALREYDYFSIQIFDELESQLATLEAGVTILSEGKAWNQSTGTFSTMGLNLDWAGDINQSWKAYDDKKKGIDKEKIEELKKYKVYAMIYTGSDGNPKVSWQIEKNGKGVMNPELYQYLIKAGKYLDEDSFEFITQDAFNKKVEKGWKNGYNYVTGEVYNKTLGKIVSNAQSVEDGINWLNESELGQAIQVLGFTYASYRVTTAKGSTTVNNDANSPKNVSLHEKYKNVLEVTEKSNPIVDSLKETGKLPDNFVSKDLAIKKGWRPGKALENYVSGGQIGGDIYQNTTKLLPDSPGRVWREADVGIVGDMSRAKQPGTRLLYSNDGLLYITTDHYNTMHFIGNY